VLPVVLALAIVSAGPSFAPPVPWALNFAAAGDFCMVGDVDGDGYADLIRVSPKGDCFIEVAINDHGMKSRWPQRALSNWGKDCQAACCANIDDVSRVDVVGVFSGDTLRLAHAFKDGTFKDEPDWIKLPHKLSKPHIDFSQHMSGMDYLIVWSEDTGDSFQIEFPGSASQAIKQQNIGRGKVWIGADDGYISMNRAGQVSVEERKGTVLPGKMRNGASPMIWWRGDTGIPPCLFLDSPGDPSGFEEVTLPTSPLPDAPCTWASGDMSHDGLGDLIQFRFGSEPHSGHDVLLYRQIPPAVGGSKAAGTPNQPAVIPNLDSSGDGLLDEWKLNGFRGLDLRALGCIPGQRDIVVLISRFSNTNKDMVESTFKNIEGYYLSLGWHLHPVFLDPVPEADEKLSWQQLREKYLPAKWQGVAHWMAVTPNGGGQANELSDGGICGGNGWSLYATFIHEFGHQLGLNHEGFWPTTGCPIYSSLMNYPYSYTFEGNIRNVHYSDGSLKDLVLHETDLDETLPYPYEKVKFLADAPYHFHLKANGKTTLIDWNWDGIFGEKHVRADINYAYSTSAGRRDDVGKTNSAPWTFTVGREAYVLYARESAKPDGKSDPSVGQDKPGWLMLRRLIKTFQWADPVQISGSSIGIPPMKDDVTGDPVAIAYRGEIVVAYPSSAGLMVRRVRLGHDKVVQNESTLVDDTNSVPSLGIYRDRLFLFEWAPKEGYVRYRTLTGGHIFGDWATLSTAGAYGTAVKSKEPVSMAVDTFTDEVLIGTAEDADAARTNHWAIRREKVKDGHLVPYSAKPTVNDSDREWVGGTRLNARGDSRCVLLFDEKGITGMKGRLVYYMLGGTNAKTPWACVYVAQSIADKSVGGGWMIKRYYDEWTQSRSGPAACWFNGDILYAYRWVDGGQGASDNTLHVGYNGSGIEPVPMGDFDDIGFIRDFGMQNSILYLRE